MIKNHKWKAIISSIVILLPIIFGMIMWKQLPATMVSHWGADGVADGSATKGFMVFGLPLILLALHWLMLLTEAYFQKRKPQNEKIVALQYVIIPTASLVISFLVYSVALEKDWNLFVLIPLLVGAMFMYIGNYLPKTVRNRTMGIKLHWTMGNDENWNKTHRFGGQIWFWCGLVVMASALLPVGIAVTVMVAVLAVAVVVPTVYSYAIYRKHRAAGIEYEPVFNQKSDKVALWITATVVPLILIGVGVLMVTGSIKITYGETDFQIVASYSEDLTVRYEDVDSVEYRENFDIGSREMGFGSPKLSTGTFRNEEFGRYTLYAYTGGEGAVVLKKGEDVLVIVAKTAAETKTVYDLLSAKIK
ncbi:MAG: SdpI family protein [Oscillospiraceae bacterium]|nr:SdpI family protein [Oscillospiraceae bacterium]